MRYALAALGIAMATLAPAIAAPAYWTGEKGDEAAVGGYDAVAYFGGAATPGNDDFAMVWQGARFRFANAANLAAFRVDPGRYAPQFGGHCAWAASQGRLATPDPKIWRVVAGKLYLNCSPEAEAKWLADVPGNIAKGEVFWAGRAN